MSLLELVIASAMLAMLMGAVGLCLRTGRQAWEAHEADYVRLEGMHAVLRHIVRQVRQADGVTQISAANDDSGSLGLRMPDGSTIVWDHVGGTNVMNCGVTTADQLLGTNITGFRVVGYKADGVTTTTVPTEIQNLSIRVSTQLPRDVGGAKSVTSWAWVRSW